MVWARRGISGDDCLRAAFPADSLQGLDEAVMALEQAHPSAAVSMLVASLNPYHWRSSRSAAAGLREQGRAALRAAPALALIGKLGPRLDRLRVDREIGPAPDLAIPNTGQASAEAAGGVSAEAAETLLALAGEDAEPDVRTAALHAIADAGAHVAGALAVALRAAASDDPRERAAAARLLAMLIR